LCGLAFGAGILRKIAHVMLSCVGRLSHAGGPIGDAQSYRMVRASQLEMSVTPEMLLIGASAV